MLCSYVPQAAAGVDHHDSMQPPSTQQVHCSASRLKDAYQSPYENGLQGSGIAPPSTAGSLNPTSEFQAVYGGFYGGFYGGSGGTPSSSDQVGSWLSGSDPPPGVEGAGSVNGGDPEEEVLILQEVTEEEVRISICAQCVPHVGVQADGAPYLINEEDALHHTPYQGGSAAGV